MTLNPDIKVQWDHGTAYDFLSSLYVLHFPDEYGLRGAWAAGVRSRMPNEVRDFLEVVIGDFNIPLAWINSLPEPKDAATALVALKQIPMMSGWQNCVSARWTRRNVWRCSSDQQARTWNQETLEELIWIWQRAGKDQRVIPGPVNEKRAARS